MQLLISCVRKDSCQRIDPLTNGKRDGDDTGMAFVDTLHEVWSEVNFPGTVSLTFQYDDLASNKPASST